MQTKIECECDAPPLLDLPALVLARYPALAHHAHLARIGRGLVWDAEQGLGVEREGCIVIEVKGEKCR